MALKKRERNLAIATGVLVVLFLGRMLLSGLGSSGNPLETQREQLIREIERKKRQIDRGKESEARLAEWQRRSLPSELEAARSLYQNWLLASANEAGFEGLKVESTQGRQRGSTYHALRFNVQARTNLDQLTRFLHRFYSAGFLHQILSLSLVPLEEGRKLEVQFSVEALALAEADRSNKLPQQPEKPLLAADASNYAKSIAGRNIFAPYRRPDPPPPDPPKFDPAKYVYLSAIVQVGDQPEAWIINRTSGDRITLRQGDDFSAGDYQGKIERIGLREVEIEVDGQRWLLPLGDNLRNAVKLPSTS
jgi:hypothetical protein